MHRFGIGAFNGAWHLLTPKNKLVALFKLFGYKIIFGGQNCVYRFLIILKSNFLNRLIHFGKF